MMKNCTLKICRRKGENITVIKVSCCGSYIVCIQHMSHMHDPVSLLYFCTDGEVDGDSDEHKELENSLSLSGTHERQGAGSIQGTLDYHSSLLLYVHKAHFSYV